MTMEMIIKRLKWAIEDKDWDAIELLMGDLQELTDDEWAVKQYNRNRPIGEHIKNVKDIPTN